MSLRRSSWIIVGSLIVILAIVHRHWPVSRDTTRGPGTSPPEAPSQFAARTPLASSTPDLGASINWINSTRSNFVKVVDAAGQPGFADPDFTFRLRNTNASIEFLLRKDRGVLLQQAFIDTATDAALAIPHHLQSGSDPGAYIVQASGNIDDSFRQALRAARAEVIAYIPN